MSLTSFRSYELQTTLQDLNELEKINVLAQVDDKTFKSLCSINKEYNRICNDVRLKERIYEERTRAKLSDEIIAFKESNMKWKEFYDRIISLINNKGHDFYEYSLARQDKLMELKILGTILTQPMLIEAIAMGRLNILKYALEQGYQINHVNNDNSVNFAGALLLSAAENGQVAVLDFFETLGFLPTNTTVGDAIVRGYLNVLKWGEQRNIIPDAESAIDAVLYDHLDILEWLYERHGVLPDEDLLNERLHEEQIDLFDYNQEIYDWLLEHHVYVRDFEPQPDYEFEYDNE